MNVSGIVWRPGMGFIQLITAETSWRRALITIQLHKADTLVYTWGDWEDPHPDPQEYIPTSLLLATKGPPKSWNKTYVQ